MRNHECAIIIIINISILNLHRSTFPKRVSSATLILYHQNRLSVYLKLTKMV